MWLVSKAIGDEFLPCLYAHPLKFRWSEEDDKINLVLELGSLRAWISRERLEYSIVPVIGTKQAYFFNTPWSRFTELWIEVVRPSTMVFQIEAWLAWNWLARLLEHCLEKGTRDLPGITVHIMEGAYWEQRWSGSDGRLENIHCKADGFLMTNFAAMYQEIKSDIQFFCHALSRLDRLVEVDWLVDLRACLSIFSSLPNNADRVDHICPKTNVAAIKERRYDGDHLELLCLMEDVIMINLIAFISVSDNLDDEYCYKQLNALRKRVLSNLTHETLVEAAKAACKAYEGSSDGTFDLSRHSPPNLSSFAMELYGLMVSAQIMAPYSLGRSIPFPGEDLARRDDKGVSPEYWQDLVLHEGEG